ncbi:MAG: hypothetical protein A3F09_01845 [Chlamydiae bacterium RIFCSPHIGHO2_12_FULL_49_11]|nr:MAG: hypothetical protein A3F09_01845 [Chlamydiae bacterium RIFCSPHIGHO2_12_FULL_49_11]
MTVRIICFLLFAFSLRAQGFFENLLEFARVHQMPALLFFHFKDASEPFPFLKEKLSPLFLIVDIPLDNISNVRRLEESHALKRHFGVETIPSLLLIGPEGGLITRFPATAMHPDHLKKSIIGIWTDYACINTALNKAEALAVRRIKGLYETAVERGFTDFRERLLTLGLDKDDGVYFLLEKYSELVSAGKADTKEAKQLRKLILQKDKIGAFQIKTRKSYETRYGSL